MDSFWMLDMHVGFVMDIGLLMHVGCRICDIYMWICVIYVIYMWIYDIYVIYASGMNGM